MDLAICEYQPGFSLMRRLIGGEDDLFLLVGGFV